MERRLYHLGREEIAPPDAVLCRDVSVTAGGHSVTIRRGTPLDEARRRLTAATSTELAIPIVVPSADDVAQPTASAAIAQAITGPGVTISDPHQGQVNLMAAHAGLLRVRGNAVAALNRGTAALVATPLDGRIVDAGETVGIVKAPALFVSRAAINEALELVAKEPVVRVAAFQAQRVALVAGARIRPAQLEVAAKQMATTLARFGAELAAVRHIPDDPATIAETYRALINDGSELILVAGSILLDPEDPFLLALETIGGRVIRRGAPIDPGTMFWAAEASGVPLFGLASCEMYGRLSILDLLLPYALAREPLSYDLIAGFGYGGLLETTQTARRLGS